jgi:hypothetical protein
MFWNNFNKIVKTRFDNIKFYYHTYKNKIFNL